MEEARNHKLAEMIAREGIKPTKDQKANIDFTKYVEDIQIKLEEDFARRTKDLNRKLIEKEKALDSERHELFAQLKADEKELHNRLAKKDVELQQERAELHAQFADRESSLRHEIANQQNALKERETIFRAQSDALMTRTRHLETEHEALQVQLAQTAVNHKNAITDLERQKEQFEADFQARMESKATEYVDDALASLKSSEKRFEWIGLAWSLAGIAAVLAGLTLGYLLAVTGTNDVISNKDISWALMLFFAAKGAILLGLVFALVRLCLKLARNYMHESLKNAERRHAINYGKFYLSVYGAGTDGEKVKDIFAHWNITGSSAFSEKDDPMPVQVPAVGVEEITKTIAVRLQKALEGEAK